MSPIVVENPSSAQGQLVFPSDYEAPMVDRQAAKALRLELRRWEQDHRVALLRKKLAADNMELPLLDIWVDNPRHLSSGYEAPTESLQLVLTQRGFGIAAQRDPDPLSLDGPFYVPAQSRTLMDRCRMGLHRSSRLPLQELELFVASRVTPESLAQAVGTLLRRHSRM